MKKQTITFLQGFTEIHSDIFVDIQGSEEHYDTETAEIRIYNRKVLLRTAGVNNMVAQRKRELFNKLKKKGVTLFGVVDNSANF